MTNATAKTRLGMQGEIMNTDPLEKMWSTDDPPEKEVIIVQNCDDKRDQVTIRNGIAYKWRYKDTDDEFCHVHDIKRWRGCTGFDF